MMCTILRTLNRNIFKKGKLPLVQQSDYSTKIVAQQEDEDDKQIKVFVQMPKIQQKTKNKKPQRQPFAKNLFLGIFDADILTYPEAIEKDNWNELKKKVQPLEDYMATTSISKTSGTTSQEHLNKLSLLEMLGLQISPLYGGQDYNHTESLYCNEGLAIKNDSIGVVNSHYNAVNFLIKYANQIQKERYFRDLVSKGITAALCLYEADCSDLKQLTTTAKLKDGNWELNGCKMSVINGESADLYIVFAQSSNFDQYGINSTGCTAFIVDKSLEGVDTKLLSTSGLLNTDISNVTFNNVKVPAENVLGNVNQGEELLIALLTEMRLGAAPLCISLTKNLLNDFINYCKSIHIEKYNLYETDLISSKIGQLVISLYAMESVAYLTTGLMDLYEKQDCELEAAITKVFVSDNCLKAANSCVEFLGTQAYLKDHWCNKYYQDALAHVLLNESNDSLKITIPLLGLQHAGTKLNEKVKMIRNPLYYPKEMFKRMWTNSRQANDNPKLNLGLNYYVHPSLLHAATALEYCVLRLQYATEILLARYGIEVLNKHMELQRLSECIILIYAATAVIGRTSRSYCIGLRNADVEMTIANAFCLNMKEIVQKNVLDIQRGPYTTNDENYKVIAKRTFDSRKYFAEHPLEKNF